MLHDARDSAHITQAAFAILKHIYRLSHQYVEAGVMLMDLPPATRQQLTLGLHAEMSKNTIRLMQAMDQIKRRCGRLRWNVKRLEFADRPVG